ncbi:Secreted effector kinase steC [Salmonella enterica subsp. enterica]|uniref:Secreted effector kinase steC n=1 Tax=Salmonella enterica I TaxID=59201 RepID=A0A379WT39_SALET|nr:Secreted effector kinase steC [Salmonella enterica subsp. enterica]
MAEALLKSRGVYMHDINILGNILIKEGVLFFVDGDQMVLSQESGNSEAFLLQQGNWKSKLRPSPDKIKAGRDEGNTEDVEYYKLLIADLDALIGEEEQTPAPGRRFKLAAPEEGTLVAKVLKNELKNSI